MTAAMTIGFNGLFPISPSFLGDSFVRFLPFQGAGPRVVPRQNVTGSTRWTKPAP